MLQLYKETSPKLTNTSEYRVRFPEFFKSGFEKETVLLIPTTPSLKAMEENCGIISDQKFNVEGGK